MKNNIAICIVAFNRPNSLKRILESLSRAYYNDKVILYISIDRAKKDDKNNQLCYEIAQKFNWQFGEKIVDFKKQNMGLKNHILSCGNLTKKYENVIILEDDIYVFPNFYEYAKAVLNFYGNNDKIAGFSLYNFPKNPANSLPFYPLKESSDCYFMQYACSWGQMWTKKQWKKFSMWYEKNKDKDLHDIFFPDYIASWSQKSWLKYFMKYVVETDTYFTFPYHSFTTNFSDIGTHNKSFDITYQNNYYLTGRDTSYEFLEFENSMAVYDCFFENIKINKLLGFRDYIEADIYEEKKKYKYKYILTSKILPYKIIEGYSLSMYSYEQNIINNLHGNELFLYDTTQSCKITIHNQNTLINYFYKIGYIDKKIYMKFKKYFRIYGKRFKFRKIKEYIKAQIKKIKLIIK